MLLHTGKKVVNMLTQADSLMPVSMAWPLLHYRYRSWVGYTGSGGNTKRSHYLVVSFKAVLNLLKFGFTLCGTVYFNLNILVHPDHLSGLSACLPSSLNFSISTLLPLFSS